MTAMTASPTLAVELPSYGAVLLTQGTRPRELATAIASLRAQRGVRLDLVVVGNGVQPAPLPPQVSAVVLPDNVGIPAGRNAGVPAVGGDLLLFLDDDASLPQPDALARLAAVFAADPSLGLVQPRVQDPEGRPSPSRWVPRLHPGDPSRSSDVCAVWEGAVVVRRTLFEAIGGWGAHFFYGHEGVELAWRVWDAGFRVRYIGEVTAHHPVVDPCRHHDALRYLARNRVWLARRNLPLPLAAAYLLTWFLLTIARASQPGAIHALLIGYRDGFIQPCGPRRPLRWRTAWLMTRAGRPPVI